MPLLEVTQTRHLSASIRLTDSTATQVDQYAAFIRASADDVVEASACLCLRQRSRLSGVPEVAGSAADYADASHP